MAMTSLYGRSGKQGVVARAILWIRYLFRRRPQPVPRPKAAVPHWRRLSRIMTREQLQRLNQVHTSNAEEIDVETPVPSRNYYGRGIRKATEGFPIDKTPAHLQPLAPMRHDSHTHATLPPLQAREAGAPSCEISDADAATKKKVL